MLMIVIYVVVMIVVIAGMWKAFEKAGQPGWACLVPIYNIYILTQMAGKPAWWIVLFLIPIVNLFAAIVMMIEIAKNFGKDSGFGIALALFGFVCWPILGFGDAKWQGVTNEDSTVIDS